MPGRSRPAAPPRASPSREPGLVEGEVRTGMGHGPHHLVERLLQVGEVIVLDRPRGEGEVDLVEVQAAAFWTPTVVPRSDRRYQSEPRLSSRT